MPLSFNKGTSIARANHGNSLADTQLVVAEVPSSLYNERLGLLSLAKETRPFLSYIPQRLPSSAVWTFNIHQVVDRIGRNRSKRRGGYPHDVHGSRVSLHFRSLSGDRFGILRQQELEKPKRNLEAIDIPQIDNPWDKGTGLCARTKYKRILWETALHKTKITARCFPRTGSVSHLESPCFRASSFRTHP